MASSLHNHSEYSVLDGFSHPKEYLDRAKEVGLKAFAITEHGNQYSWVYFDKLKKDYPDIKMIYGVELYECFDINVQDQDSKYFHLIALAKNEKGRIALNEIITKSNFEGFYYKPRVDLEMLKPYTDDLIILSACLASKIARESDYNKCVEYVNEYKSIFTNFYLEMQSHKTEDQAHYNRKILELAHDTNTEFVITTDSHAATKEDLYYQARHVQIARDDDTLTELYDDCYVQTDDEIHAIMDSQIGQDNVDIGIKNSDVIADMIDVVNMPFQSPQLPTFPLPEGYEDNYSYLKDLCDKGWYTRGINKLSLDEQKVRRNRLNYELGIIHQMGFDGYFLFVWDFIRWARDNDVYVGDGRGSGGGAIVDYLLGISELDPISYNLIFERFLNPERVSMPDIDTDFSDREKVVRYLTEKYGEDRVCQVINFSYITPIVAINDVGRVLGIPYNVCKKISKKFVYETFEECIENNPNLYEEFVDYKELFDIASKISGRVRQASIHAGGVGIVDTKITDYMAMKVGSKGEHVIQVDKKIIEDIGIIKFDLLGLATTLNTIKYTCKYANIDKWEIDINNPDFLNNTEMYELLCSANTNGVFQVESQGMKDLLLRLQPSNLEDVSAVLALYRPDSMGALDEYIECKHGRQEVHYIHPDMKPILESTYGCMIYQEQLMDIVRVFGGRTYGGADKFRKAIGKKDIALVKSESAKLYQEIIDNGYSEEIAKQISDELSTKGGYLFNKSHSALYSVLTLKTAYLKKKYPVEFFCALLNQKRDDYGSLNKYILDAKEFGVTLMPPHLNKSDRGFSVNDGKILFGLEAIKGVGEKFVDSLLEERSNGKFKNFNNFYERMSPSNAVVIALTKAGAIPCKDKRKFLLQFVDSQIAQKEYKPVVSLPKLSVLKEKYGIDTDVIKDKTERLRLYNIEKEKEYIETQKEKYNKSMTEFNEKYLQNEKFWEFDALSVFINDNPFVEAYKYIRTPFDEVEEGSKGLVVGIIANIQKKKDRNGKQFAFLWMYSAFGLIEVICWHTQYKQYEDLIKRGNQIAMLCQKSDDKAVIKEMKTYEQWLDDRKLSQLK
nr:MAG TPA: DNA polymerase III, alpha subunit [Caudoviricetes sp.]